METIVLGKACTKIGSGLTPRGGKSVYLDEGVALIRSQNVYNEGFSYDGLAFIDDKAAEAMSNVEVKEGDNLLNITGDSVARACQVPTGILPARVNQHVAIIRTNPKILDPRFLHYYFISPEMQTHMLNLADSGGTRKALTKEMIEDFEITAPPLDEQILIASFLGTLDDKIVMNSRMNRLLESMARSVHKSWLEDFDAVRSKASGKRPIGMAGETAALFPESLEDSELGEIPDGWRVVPLRDVVEINPRRNIPKGSDAPFLDMKNMPTTGHRPDAWVRKPFKAGSRFANGDTLVARITPCLENGKTAYVDFLIDDEIGWGSTEFIVMRPKPPLPAEYGYLLARSENFRNFAIQSMTGSSGRQRVVVEVLDEYLVVRPPDRILRELGDFVHPIMELVKANAEQSMTLARLRDAFLPKLLSGEIRIPADKNRKIELAKLGVV